jgi:hypothetical protein
VNDRPGQGIAAAVRRPAGERSPGASGPRSARWRAITASSWFLLSFAVYLSNGRAIGSGDTRPAALIPIAVLLDGTVMLDRFVEAENRFSPHPYWIVETPRGAASLYPVATGVLATPIYAIPVLYHHWRQPLGPDAWRDRAVGTYQKYAAAIFVALSVAVIWSILLELGVGFRLSVALTILYAFGSEALAVASQGLWQHGPGSLALLGVIRSLLALDRRPRSAALLAGMLAGVAIAIRPTNLVLAAPLLLAGLHRHPRQCLWLLLPTAAILAPVIAYNEAVFGDPLGAYGGVAAGFSRARFLSGLAGSLVSPARGLLLYFPAVLLALALMTLRPALRRDPLVLAILSGVVLLTGLNASWWAWHGGHCFGPRLFTEAQGPITVLLGLGLRSSGHGFRACVLLLALIVPYSVFLQAMGAFSTATIAWNTIPDSNVKARVWDFDDNPIFRGIRALRE